MNVGYQSKYGYNAGIFHSFTAPVFLSATFTYQRIEAFSVLVMIEDTKNGGYTAYSNLSGGSVNQSFETELEKGQTVVICYYNIGTNTANELAAPYVNVSSDLGQVSFDTDTDSSGVTAETCLISNGSKITIPNLLKDGSFLAGWYDSMGNLYEGASEFTVNGNTDFFADFDLFGDLDSSGSLTAIDISLMRKYLAKTETDIYEKAADMNTDGYINLKDLVKIKKALAGIN